MKSTKCKLIYDKDTEEVAAFEYINKDLDFLLLLLLKEARADGNTRLNFGWFFKGNYWHQEDIRDELLDTNDHYSIPDMVYSQLIHILHSARLGNVTQVGIDNTRDALHDVLVEVAKIGKENAQQEVEMFVESIENICEYEKIATEKRWKEALKIKDGSERAQHYAERDYSVSFEYDEPRTLKKIQSILVDVPQHIFLDVVYDDFAFKKLDQSIADYFVQFEKDQLLDNLPRYLTKRPYFAQQLEAFAKYIQNLPHIGNVANIPFGILNERGFEAVKMLAYLQHTNALTIRWLDEQSWKVEFSRMPVIPNTLLGKEVPQTPEISDKNQIILHFDPTKSRLNIGTTELHITRNTDAYHIFRIMFENEKELAQEWFFSDFAERIDKATHDPDKKYHNAISHIKRRIYEATKLADVLITTSHSVTINPKYIR